MYVLKSYITVSNGPSIALMTTRMNVSQTKAPDWTVYNIHVSGTFIHVVISTISDRFEILFYMKCILIDYLFIEGGRKFLTQTQIDHYLHETKSKLTIELFVFDNKVNMKQLYCPDGKILNPDISSGQENVPISVVNEVDKEPGKIEEPSAFTYRVERTPVKGVNMVINEPTMTCCTCTDGCRNRAKCACKLFI